MNKNSGIAVSNQAMVNKFPILSPKYDLKDSEFLV
jgi:hypothetical protein